MSSGAAGGELETLWVRVIQGPDRGRQVALGAEALVVGTAPGCSLSLSDSTVSRRHLSLQRNAGGVVVTDLGSKNKTRFHGELLTVAVVPVGAVLSVGKTQLALLPRMETDGTEQAPFSELHGLVGHSPAMRHLFAQMERVAKTESMVLLEGETGAGKKLVARALHLESARAQGPLTVLGCGAPHPEPLRARLFGDAKQGPGLLELTDHGTLVLDDVAELSLALQSQLLRVLLTGQLLRLGEEGPARRVDVRVIATTHTPLEGRVKKGLFRSNLFHRLAGVVLRVPPLRERTEDVLPLAERLAAGSSSTPLSWPPHVRAALGRYAWPGNGRELLRLVERYVLLGDSAFGPAPSARTSGNDDRARERALRAFERAYLEDLLTQGGGSPSRAARLGQMPRSHMFSLLAKHGLARVRPPPRASGARPRNSGPKPRRSRG